MRNQHLGEPQMQSQSAHRGFGHEGVMAGSGGGAGGQRAPGGGLRKVRFRRAPTWTRWGSCIFTPVEMPEKHKAKSTPGVLPAPKQWVGPDPWWHGGQRTGHSTPTFLISNMRGPMDQASEPPSDPKVGTVRHNSARTYVGAPAPPCWRETHFLFLKILRH